MGMYCTVPVYWVSSRKEKMAVSLGWGPVIFPLKTSNVLRSAEHTQSTRRAHAKAKAHAL